VHFRLEYVHPYMGSTQNPYNHTLRVGAFSKRKLSAMFADGESSDTSPGVWIDRAGIKANITEVWFCFCHCSTLSSVYYHLLTWLYFCPPGQGDMYDLMEFEFAKQKYVMAMVLFFQYWSSNRVFSSIKSVYCTSFVQYFVLQKLGDCWEWS
jgi:hypothetical protein